MTVPARDVKTTMVVRQAREPATPAIGVACCDLRLRFTWVNPGFAAWLGCSAAEITGRPIEEVLGHDAFLVLRPAFERVLDGEAIEREHELDVRRLGRRWVSMSCTPTRDRSGAVDGWIAVVVDVTSQKTTQQELLRHALIVESTDDAVLSRSVNGLILSWNQGAQRLFGYAEEEVIGRPSSIIVPDDRREEEESILARVRNGEHIERHETRRVTSGGRPIDVSVTISPIRNRLGEIIGVCDIARDITDRKQVEKSLLWRLDFERELTELSRTFISLPDDEIDANVERALGRIGAFLDIDRVTLFESSGPGDGFRVRFIWTKPGVTRPPHSLTHVTLPWWTERTMRGEMSIATRPSDLPEEAAAEKEYFLRVGVVSAASIPLNVGGEITGAISFATHTRPVVWTDDVVGLLRVLGDIFSNALKRRRAMADLRAAQTASREGEERFRRRLVQAQEDERASVSRELHDDINQRLTLAILNLETIRRGKGLPGDLRQEVSRVVEQLGELSGDIQALSYRLHSAKLEQLGLTATAAGFCREIAAQYEVIVEFECEGIPGDLPPEVALCLFRVLQEAVQNATKHSAATHLRVALAAGTDAVTLTVCDSGKGFDVRQAMAAGGTGLANMHERVRLVGGTLSIESGAGRGTVLHARVPYRATVPDVERKTVH